MWAPCGRPLSQLSGSAKVAQSCLFSSRIRGRVPRADRFLLDLDHTASQSAFPIAANGRAAAIYVAPGNPETVRVAVTAFAADVAKVTGAKPRILTSLKSPLPPNLIIVGVLGKSPELDKLRAAKRLVTTSIDSQWEAAETVTILNPPPTMLRGVSNALIIAAPDRRGAAYALFALSRADGRLAVDLVGRCSRCTSRSRLRPARNPRAGFAFGPVPRHLSQR